MVLFWVLAGLLAAVAAALVLARAARAAPQGAVGEAVADDPAQAVYRRQLSEIDDLAERGLMPDGERKAAHAEAARRLLNAADRLPIFWRAGRNDRKIVLGVVVATPAAALALYMALGAPGYPDQPFEARVAAWRAADPRALSAEQMAAVLTEVVRARPGDVEGWRFLALARGASDDAAGAVRALRRAIELEPRRADLWEMMGRALAYQAEGVAGPNAIAAYRRAVELDPGLASAREALEAAERPPPPMAAIQGMVAGLAARLAEQPDDPDGWVRLVRSYAVLGDTVARDRALGVARARYAGQPKVLAELTTAAATERMTTPQDSSAAAR